MTVHKTAIPEYLDLPAHIEADPTRVVHVFAPAGGRITEMRVRPWDRVEKGQTLAMLESSDLARAVADYHKALADNQVKQKELARSQDLLDHKAISEREFQQAQGDAQMSQAEVQAAREQVQVFGMDPDHASTQLLVKAPRVRRGSRCGRFFRRVFAGAFGRGPSLHHCGHHHGVGRRRYLRERPRRGEIGAGSAGDPECLSRSALDRSRECGFRGGRSHHANAARPRCAAQSRSSNQAGDVRLDQAAAVVYQGILVPSTAVVREGNDAYVYVRQGNGRFVAARCEAGPGCRRHAGDSVGSERRRTRSCRKGRYSCAPQRRANRRCAR